MTPKREKYLAKCSNRELWLRRLIKIHKEAIKKALNMVNLSLISVNF